MGSVSVEPSECVICRNCCRLVCSWRQHRYKKATRRPLVTSSQPCFEGQYIKYWPVPVFCNLLPRNKLEHLRIPQKPRCLLQILRRGEFFQLAQIVSKSIVSKSDDIHVGAVTQGVSSTNWMFPFIHVVQNLEYDSVDSAVRGIHRI